MERFDLLLNRSNLNLKQLWNIYIKIDIDMERVSDQTDVMIVGGGPGI